MGIVDTGTALPLHALSSRGHHWLPSDPVPPPDCSLGLVWSPPSPVFHFLPPLRATGAWGVVHKPQTLNLSHPAVPTTHGTGRGRALGGATPRSPMGSSWLVLHCSQGSRQESAPGPGRGVLRVPPLTSPSSASPSSAFLGNSPRKSPAREGIVRDVSIWGPLS